MNGTGDGIIPTNESAISVITKTIATLAVLTVLAICVLSYQGKEIPAQLDRLAVALATALTTMLVKTSPSVATSSADSPAILPIKLPVQDVKIVNQPKDSVPTTEIKETNGD